MLDIVAVVRLDVGNAVMFDDVADIIGDCVVIISDVRFVAMTGGKFAQDEMLLNVVGSVAGEALTDGVELFKLVKLLSY